jgi:hypothetical protein
MWRKACNWQLDVFGEAYFIAMADNIILDFDFFIPSFGRKIIMIGLVVK